MKSVQKAAASSLPRSEVDEETPRRYVTLAATCILVGGTVSLLTWLAVMFALPDPADANESLEFVRFMLVVQKVLGLPIALLMIYGGMQLQQLKSVEWGLAAAVLCLLPIHACCLVSFIPGVIGLSVLSNPRVTQLIRKERAKLRQRRG